MVMLSRPRKTMALLSKPAGSPGSQRVNIGRPPSADRPPFSVYRCTRLGRLDAGDWAGRVCARTDRRALVLAPSRQASSSSRLGGVRQAASHGLSVLTIVGLILSLWRPPNRTRE